MKKFLRSCAMLLALAVIVSAAAVTVSADAVVFSDVSAEDYFYPAVQWGAEEGITLGVGEGLFAPDGQVTRAQVVTFLWNMAGKPEVTASETFSDVEAGSWYEAPVKWATTTGITLGTGEGKFSPDKVCDRAMCITLLYRLMDSPLDDIDFTKPAEYSDDMTLEELGEMLVKVSVTSMRESGALSDVPEGSYYEIPVIWACFTGVVTKENTGDIEQGAFFRPTDPCVRKEMISFLYQTKLSQDAGNEPLTYTLGELTLPVPQDIYPFLAFDVYGAPEEDTPEKEEVLITVSELASREAAEAMGEENTDGIGELFTLKRVNDVRLQEMLCEDMSGETVFAKDENGGYYVFCCPTDVRFVRESNEKMTEDAEQWTMLNEWARTDLIDEIMKHSEGLSPVSYTNTMLDMYLARILYSKGVKYTLSTTAYGPLDPGKFDGSKYAEYLLEGNFVSVDDVEAPDGEYAVLNFPDDGIRYDFFDADRNLVREVREGYTEFYRRVLPGSVTNFEAMEGWYLALAEQAGKKKDYKELDPFLGDWREEIAGRGFMTVSKSVAPAKADIEVSWAGSAFETAEWKITANLTEDGKLVYNNGEKTVIRYDEDGKSSVVSKITDEAGVISVGKDGKLVWKIGEEEDNTFVRAE